MCSVVAERNERSRAVNAAAAAADPVLLPTRSPRCRDTRSANYAITEILPPQSAAVAWHSGRTSVSGRRTFPVLRSTCS